MMKIKISMLLSVITAFIFTACNDDDNPNFKNPYRFNIVGAGTVSPETTSEYTIGDFVGETYTWTIDGPAQIVGDASGTTVDVEFMSVGEVVLTVSNGTESGTLTVEIAEVEPVVATSLNGTGVLKEGDSDTIFFSFDAPLAIDPQIEMNKDTSAFVAGTDAFISGSLGELMKTDEMNYYVVFTAGSGNGTPEGFLTDVQSREAFGGVNLDSLGYMYVQLYEVDNIDPVADLSYSQERVNDSTMVTVTATFSEPVTFENGLDSAFYVSFSGAGVAVESDSLQSTDDPLVYTYEYTVNGEGNGSVTVDIDNVTDLAGNQLAVVNNATGLSIDNMAPVVVGITNDGGDFASVDITSTEDGAGMYLILVDGETAPTTAEEFLAAEGVVSGAVNVNATVASTAVESLETGNYDVYYMSLDEAGNYSAIVSSELAMD